MAGGYDLKPPAGDGDGTPLDALLDFQDGGKLAHVMRVGLPEDKYLIANSGAYGFIARIADMMSRNKAAKFS